MQKEDGCSTCSATREVSRYTPCAVGHKRGLSGFLIKGCGSHRCQHRSELPGDERHHTHDVDAFKFLSDMESDKYDLIILDPPAFAKHRGAIKNGLIGYRKLNARAFEKIQERRSTFHILPAHRRLPKDMFRMAVFTAAAKSGRKVRILHQLTQPADHPVDISHPGG